MRIVHVINDATLGGAQTFVEGLAAGWTVEGDELHLVVLRGRDVLSPRFARAFASVTYLDAARHPVRAAIGFRRRLRDLRPDAVHSHLLQSDLVALLLAPHGSRRFTTVHTTGLTASDPVLSRVIARVVGRLSGRFERVVACNETCLAYTRSQGYRATTVVIENGLAVPDEPSYDAASTNFLSLARLHPMKGHAVLIDAFSRVADELPEWTLTCVGAGVTPTAPELADALADARARQLVADGRLRLDGPTLEPSDHLARAAALVISSTYGEASPMVAIEAISHGVPVLATDVGGSPALVGAGLPVAEPGSAASLAAALRAFAGLPPEQRSGLSAWSREQAVDRFDVGRRVEAYRALYAGSAS